MSNGNRSNDELGRKFSNLDKYVDHKSHLPRIRLFFQLLGLGGSDVANKVRLREFYSILRAHREYKQRALVVMQYILSFVGVCTLTIVDLDTEALEYCKLALGYPSAVIGMCIQISDEDFKRLQTFGGDHLKCLPGKIETIEELCLLLHQKVSIQNGDVVLISQWLDEIDRNDLAKRLDKYAQTGCYEDPVICGSLGNGTFPGQPTQATSKSTNG